MEIIKYFSDIEFVPSGFFAYSASEDLINYDPECIEDDLGKLDLLHEISHYLLGHIDYDYDIELLLMEVAAWDKTKELTKKFDVIIDQDYVDECIDTYDKWLNARSTCPECDNFSLQLSEGIYKCFICKTVWKVNKRKDKRTIRQITN